MQESSQEVESGGWSGWFDPHSKENETNTELNGETRGETSIAQENDEDAPDDENNQTQDDVESLLKKLGIDVDSEFHSEVKDAKVWHRWSEEEVSRDYKQWMPVRENAGKWAYPTVSLFYVADNQRSYFFFFFLDNAMSFKMDQPKKKVMNNFQG